MATDGATRRTFLILLEEPHAWVAAATLARRAPPGSVETLIAPLPGVAFLAAAGSDAEELEEWWGRMATAPGRPVVLAAHEDELPHWIPGLDADFVVAVPDERALRAYDHLPNVIATVDDDPRQLAELALRDPNAPTEPPPPREPPTYAARLERPPFDQPGFGPPPPAAYDPSAGQRPPTLRAPQPAHSGRMDSARVQPTPAAAGSERALAATERTLVIDPFELMSRADPVDSAASLNGARHFAAARETTPISRATVLGARVTSQPAPDPRPRPAAARSGFDPRQILDRFGPGRRVSVGTELGQALLACKPLVAAVVSRKGGVGKTASAAAVAAILGEAVDPFGHTAALVDANVGNPDAWGRLDVRGHAATMRDVVRALMTGGEPPTPAFAETPALAVYPESREAGDGYAPAQIQRVAGFLRARHAAVVVDLPNRLPAFTSAEAAVAAAWVGEADVLVLPTTADPTALLGAIEYLDADSVQGKPIVVSYIVPRIRQIRDAPQVRGMLDRIRGSVSAMVEVPDDDRATLALIQRVAITEVGNDLRQAYLALATRVVEAAASRNGTRP